VVSTQSKKDRREGKSHAADAKFSPIVKDPMTTEQIWGRGSTDEPHAEKDSRQWNDRGRIRRQIREGARALPPPLKSVERSTAHKN
jgi:hypothetical protein